MRIYPKVKVAAVQAGPVYLDMAASLDKACRLIEEAAREGCKLVAFPEAFLPGYPYWSHVDDPISVMPYTQALFAQAMECPGFELSKIAASARENNIYVMISGTEREQSSVYCTQFLFDNRGNMINKHRKTKPMHSEKMIWGEGDASTMKVVDTPFGKIGSLMSNEHMNAMNSMVMCSQREEIHVASYAALPKSPVNYRTYNTHFACANCYAVSNACFVIFATQVMDKATVDALCKDHPEYLDKLPTCENGGIGGGASCIMNPDGDIISNTLAPDEEGIVTAELDLSAIGIANFFGDTTGHYCNPAVHLEVSCTPRKVVNFNGCQQELAISYETMNTYEGGSDNE